MPKITAATTVVGKVEPASKRSKFNTIAFKLIAILLPFGLVPALLVFAVFEFTKQEFRNAFAKPVVAMAVQVNEIIDRNLFERYGDLSTTGCG